MAICGWKTSDNYERVVSMKAKLVELGDDKVKLEGLLEGLVDPRCDARSKAIGQFLEKITGVTCPAEDQLKVIRNTLLLNFGNSPHNTHGFKVLDNGTTFGILLEVLEHLTNRNKEL